MQVYKPWYWTQAIKAIKICTLNYTLTITYMLLTEVKISTA